MTNADSRRTMEAPPQSEPMDELSTTETAEPCPDPGAAGGEPAPGPMPAPLSGFPELSTIYDEHARAIYYLALRFLGDPTQAEDATHDVFLKAYRAIKSFKGKSAVRTWLYRIAINHCQNLLRSWHHRHIQNCVDDAVWNTTPGGGDCPFRVLEAQELGERIQRTLDALPEEYRLILLLVADEKLSYEEVAELTDQSVDAVRGKLHRARKAYAGAFHQLD
jgi:RNA polymerase sigma-70 factor (ECF subfamily)